MKQTDLRIGNLVFYRDEKICLVSNLGNSFETTFSGIVYGSDSIDEYNGVKLTENHLIKNGFIEDNLDEYVLNEEMVIDLVDGVFRFSVNDEGRSNAYNHVYVDLKYVHHLQNLYFILNGKELPFEI